MRQFGLPPVFPLHAKPSDPETTLAAIAMAVGDVNMCRHMCLRDRWIYLTHAELGWHAAPVDLVKQYVRQHQMPVLSHVLTTMFKPPGMQ